MRRLFSDDKYMDSSAHLQPTLLVIDESGETERKVVEIWRRHVYNSADLSGRYLVLIRMRQLMLTLRLCR